jgi:hypothetical protein
MANCLNCIEHGKEVPGTMDDYNMAGPYCDECWEVLWEAARRSDLPTLRENYDAAMQARRELRSKD